MEFSKVPHVIHFCMCLHNFCINERLAADPTYSVEDEIDNFVAAGMSASDDFYYCETAEGEEELPKEIRTSVGALTRDILVEKISSLNLKRPPRSDSQTFA